MFVLTIDQRHSRRGRDQVDDLLRRLAETVPATAVVRRFERTAGDEVQGVLRAPEQVVAVAMTLVRLGNWSVGLGVGPVNEPLPPSTRAGSGPAFERARQGVDRAKSHASRVVVVAHDPAAARPPQAVLDLLAVVVQRRSDAGWEAVDLRASGLRQSEVAARLGVTKQAVSQRLLTAAWEAELAGRELAAQLLAATEARERVQP